MDKLQKSRQMRMFKNRYFSLNLILSLTLILTQAWVLVLNRQALPPRVPLWYSKPWGEEQLAFSWQLWLVPGLSVVFLIINLILANYFYRQERFLGKMIMAVNTVVSLLGALVILRIVSF